MSYIDSFDHEFIGYFGGIPVYHPLEAVPASADTRDFACGPENLVIGGGSGEHPGLVVKDVGETVNCFVQDWLASHEARYPNEHKALLPIIDAWPGASLRTNPGWRIGYWERVFEFAGWNVANYVEFSTRCVSPAFPRPFVPSEHGDGSLEWWLAASVGEFCLLAMPELAQDAIQQLGDLRSHIAKRIDAFSGNILLSPPGYPVWGWGTSAWRIQREQNPPTIRR
ncbi:MAG: hypothetical protein ACK5OB_17125 [Pirellula sp.]